MSIEVKIPQLKGFREALRKAPLEMASNLDTAIKKSIFKIKEKTSPKTPLKTGDLRRSLSRGIQFKPLRGVIGSSLPYAKVQHDNLTFRHSVGEAKFLAKGVKESKKDIRKFSKAAIGRTLKSIKRKSCG